MFKGYTVKFSPLALFSVILLISVSAYADEDYKYYPNSKCSFVISIDGAIQSDGTKTVDCSTLSGKGIIEPVYTFTQNKEQIIFAGPSTMSYGDILIVSEVTIGGTQLGASGTCNGKFSGNMSCVVSLKGGGEEPYKHFQKQWGRQSLNHQLLSLSLSN